MNTPTTKRFRHAVVSIDSDSEGDPEIDISASLTLEGVSMRHQAFPTKRLKTTHLKPEYTPHNVTVFPVQDTTVNHPDLKGNPAEEKRKNQVCFLSCVFWVTE